MAVGPTVAGLTEEGLTDAGTTAGDTMVTVRVSETYDLSTQTNKMGIVGIHTPVGSLIERMYPGLVRQYEKFRFIKCDVTMACASILPADPLQVGVEAGDIAPQDMFNPILYKAVSNDSMNTFLQFVQYYASNSGNPDETDITDVVKGPSIASINSTEFKNGDVVLDQFKMYYALLADSDGWKKAMPQQGLAMRGLYPLVYSVVSPYGLNSRANGGSGAPGVAPYANKLLDVSGNNGPGNTDNGTYIDPALGTSANNNSALFVNDLWPNFRGPSMRMPAINCKAYWPHGTKDSSLNTQTEGENAWAQFQSVIGSMPPCYVGLVVLPPAKLNQLYYRMRVTWTVEFINLQSSIENMTFIGMDAIGSQAYTSDYLNQSANMTSLKAMADTAEVSIEKIMEGN